MDVFQHPCSLSLSLSLSEHIDEIKEVGWPTSLCFRVVERI